MQFHEAGQYDEAVRSFRQAIEHNPELWNAYQYIGTDLYQMGRASEAVIYFEKLLEHSPDPQLAAWVESVKSQLKEQQGSSHG
jgi:tetratricopeptide (TPR) repeat protein